MTVSRIAPTPSGYLHLGNAVNFLLIHERVRAAGGKLILRIDDMDETRCRREFVDDVFYTLEWLGIEYDEGPSGTEDFYRNFSMARKRDYYFEQLQTLSETTQLLYACECSRRDIEAVSDDGRYPGTCFGRNVALRAQQSAMRIHVPEGTGIEVGGARIALDREMGDFVLWRKDGLPAYQFVSVIEDRDMGVTEIVRGVDLLESSAAQLYLARAMGAEAFGRIRFVHHDLITDEQGRKLSKSEGAWSVHSLRRGDRERALRRLRTLMRELHCI